MLAAIDKQKPVPLYYQMKEAVKAQILSGELHPGDKLPTEQWYCEYFGISRVTVRKAIAALLQDGVIERSRGQGPVVCVPKINRELGQLSGLAQSLKAQGHKVTSKILYLGEAYAGSEEERYLKAPQGTRLLLLKRLRYSDGMPLVVQSVRLRLELYDILKDADLENESLYELLERNGVVLEYAEQSVTAMMPTRDLQKSLAISEVTPLLYIKRTAYLPTDVPVEYSESWYVASEFNLTVTLHR